MNDRPLYVLASRAAVMLGIHLAGGPPGFPADPDLRVERTREGFRDGLGRPRSAPPIWLELTREVGPWQLVARDGDGFRVVLFEGSTPARFRAAFDAWESAERARDAVAEHRRTLRNRALRRALAPGGCDGR